MARRVIALALVICLLLQIGCATNTKMVPVGHYDYNALNDAKRIFVTMKTGEKYEVRDFVATDDAIVGTAVTRVPGSATETRAVALKMQDVASIEVERAESGGGGMPFWGYLIGGVVLGVAIVAAICAIAASSSNN